ncbi:MAG: STAS domain-containing protein [Candidatus Brocadiia bacterium]
MPQLIFSKQVVKLGDGSECLVVKISGSIDSSSMSEFDGALGKFIQNNYYQMVFNLSGLSYISSSGLGSLMRYVQKCREKGGDIKITHIPPNIWAIFRTVGLNAIFEVINSDQQAINRFQQQASYRPVDQRNFPAKFKCPGCQAQIEIAKPGKYGCPHCHTYFAAEDTGAIKSFIPRRPKMIEAKIMGDEDGLEWIKGLVRSQTQWLNFTKEGRDRMEMAIDKTYKLVTSKLNTSKERNYRVVVVPGKDDLSVALVDLKRSPFEKNGLEDSKEWKDIQKLVDTLEFIPLTPNGYIVKLLKVQE